jgi:hypothetical protein
LLIINRANTLPQSQNTRATAKQPRFGQVFIESHAHIHSDAPESGFGSMRLIKNTILHIMQALKFRQNLTMHERF